MEVALICSGVVEKTVKKLLLRKGFSLDESADIIFIERGIEYPDREGLFIVFELEDLTKLIDFLDRINLKSAKLRGITGKCEENYEFIFYDNIAYFEADGNYVYCVTIDGEYYEIKEKLYQLEKILDQAIFVRVSRSYIVNILNVAQISPYFKGKMLLKFDELVKEIVVTRSYSKSFKSFLGI
ncbi:MAG: LytR/AlgR family response regulator transcription factor [Halothermotrichaceae bacterium]